MSKLHLGQLYIYCLSFQIHSICLVCKTESGRYDLFSVPTGMMLSIVSRRCWKDTAGRRDFCSWLQVDSLCLLLWSLVSMQDIQWHSSSVTFSGFFARSFLRSFSDYPENNFPATPRESCRPQWFLLAAQEEVFLLLAPASSPSADFSISQKVIGVPSLMIPDLSLGRGEALPYFFPCLSVLPQCYICYSDVP